MCSAKFQGLYCVPPCFDVSTECVSRTSKNFNKNFLRCLLAGGSEMEYKHKWSKSHEMVCWWSVKLWTNNTPVGSWTLCRKSSFKFQWQAIEAIPWSHSLLRGWKKSFMGSNITLHFFVKFVCVYVHEYVNLCIEICECRLWRDSL